MAIINSLDLINPNTLEAETNLTKFQEAMDALYEGDFPAFKDMLPSINLNGYFDYEGHHRELISGHILSILLYPGVPMDEFTPLMEAVMEQNPNLDLPFWEEQEETFYGFLLSYRSEMVADEDTASQEKVDAIIRHIDA